jgi:hypothetical protein
MMIRVSTVFVFGSLLAAACAAADQEQGTASPPAATGGAPAQQTATVACAPMGDRMPVAGRASPYDSAMVALNGAEAKVCYGRPAARGRTVFGGLVAYDQIWRTGANEPTILHVPVAATVAGIRLEPGSYSLYTIPGQQEWTIILNRSITQWGIEGAYTAEIQAQEVGRARVPVERTGSPVETFTIRSEGTDPAQLVLEWEFTRVRVPVRRA